MNNKLKYLEFINIAVELSSIIPPYSSKYSKKTFTQQQLLTLLVLKQKSKLSYDDFVDDFGIKEGAMLELGLFRVPSASCLKRFAARIGCKIIEKIVGSCINFTGKKKLDLGIDATGYHLEDGSYHYRKRLGKACKTRKNIKLSIAVDTEKQLIVASKIRKSKAHDNKDFILLVKKSSKIKPIKIAVADKGYDDEKNHIFVREEIQAKCIIPPRNKTSKKHMTQGMYRKKLRNGYSKKKYHQRSKVETINFVMKRLFGEVVVAKKWMMQKKEMLFKCLAYNIRRLVILGGCN